MSPVHNREKAFAFKEISFYISIEGEGAGRKHRQEEQDKNIYIPS